MFNGLKSINKRMRNLRKEDNLQLKQMILNNDGKVTININLKDINDAYSPYAPKNEPLLNSAFKDYLLTDDKIIHDLVLVTENDKLYDSIYEQERYINAIRNDFKNDNYKVSKQMHFNTYKSIALLVFGMLILSLASIFSSLLNDIYLNTIDILAWVIIWEAFDGIFLYSRELRNQYIKIARIREANFLFKQTKK